MATEIKSFCRVCTSACGLVVEVEGQQVLRVRGDTDHPLTQGYSCSKGRGLPRVHHGPDRLLHPRIRRDGALVRADWEEALDDLADKLRRIIDSDGPQAIGIFLGGGGYMDAAAYHVARAIPAALGTPAVYSDMSVDVMSKMLVSEMMAGIGGMMSRPDFARCRMILYIGTNPVVSHGHTSMLNVPAARLREAVAQGEVWVLDPRRTETAAKANRHLMPRPGSDYAILAWLIRELLQDGADHAYLAAHAQGLDGLAAAVAPFDLSRAEAVSGIAAADLQDLLAAVRRAGRLCVETGTGISMSRAANVTQWLSWALMIVTGSLDREGGAWINPGFLAQIDRQEIPAAPPEGWRMPGPRSRPELLTVLGEYPSAAIPDEIEAGHLRAILNMSGNLATCLPQTDRTLAALARLEVLATVEIIETATTAVSTHVFPAKDQLERADLPLAVDVSFPAVASQYTPAVVSPPPGMRSYWWTMAQLGKRLGHDFLPGLDPDTASDEDVLAHIAARGRHGIDRLRQERYVVDAPVAIGWLERFADGLGGWRLAPQPLVDQLAEMEPPAPLVLIPRRQRHHINSRIMDPRDHPSILLSPEDAADAGLTDGAPAIVRSAHGAIEGVVELDRTLQRGVMTVPHGFAGPYNVNQLTSCDDVDPLTGMPRMSGLAVSVSAV
ncbi:molybdopterin-containing oxidoreductase family protein [Flavisphingomonas formosensis]|uniref:molybdopterin-containing oxidoreductase family protein n=1 Tax=Flavisphingomonas formosensis TaxID=861534 RepID=UPI0012FC89FF|nr:molybdopterin-dependent oxidoreductase [Sphingomonas formosensis]